MLHYRLNRLRSGRRFHFPSPAGSGWTDREAGSAHGPAASDWALAGRLLPPSSPIGGVMFVAMPLQQQQFSLACG
jgi:hypothetical protein